MADMTFITLPRLPEAGPAFTHTPLTQRFTTVMRDLSTYIEAERDLEHCGSCDPACDAWIRDAERARGRVLESLATLLATPVVRVEDLPLRHYGIVTRNIIESATPQAFFKALNLPSVKPRLFHSCGDRVIARRVNLLIARFQHHLAELSTLSDFTDGLDVTPFAPTHHALDKVMVAAA